MLTATTQHPKHRVPTFSVPRLDPTVAFHVRGQIARIKTILEIPIYAEMAALRYLQDAKDTCGAHHVQSLLGDQSLDLLSIRATTEGQLAIDILRAWHDAATRRL